MRAYLRWLVVLLFAAGLVISAQARQSSSQQSQRKVPDKYYEFLGRANYAFQHAKNKDGYAKAAELFQQAAAVAPWLPDTYFDLGEAQKSAEEFTDAVSSLQHYLELKPDASDRDKVKIEIAELKGEAQQAAAQPTTQQEAPTPEMQEQGDAGFIHSLDGARYQRDEGQCGVETFLVQGQWLSDDFYNRCRRFHIKGYAFDMAGNPMPTRLPITGRQAAYTVRVPGGNVRCGQVNTKVLFIISRDKILMRYLAQDGTPMDCPPFATDRIFQRVQ